MAHEGVDPNGKAVGTPIGVWAPRRDYILFDETAIWKQIPLKTG